MKKYPPTTSHNHLPKVMEYLRTYDLKDTTDIDVRHDSWCDVYTIRPASVTVIPRYDAGPGRSTSGRA